MRVAGCMLILGFLISGCGSLSGGDKPHIVARPDSTGACEALLPKADAEALIGTDLGDPQTVSMDDLSLCGWIQADNNGRLAAGSIEASEWAKNLPKAVALVKQRYSKAMKPKQLGIIERRLAQGIPSTSSEACAMFRILISLEYPSLEKDSESFVSFVPDKEHATAVSAQSCAEGRFRTLAWVRPSGLTGTNDVADKFLDALTKLD